MKEVWLGNRAEPVAQRRDFTFSLTKEAGKSSSQFCKEGSPTSKLGEGFQNYTAVPSHVSICAKRNVVLQIHAAVTHLPYVE